MFEVSLWMERSGKIATSSLTRLMYPIKVSKTMACHACHAATWPYFSPLDKIGRKRGMKLWNVFCVRYLQCLQLFDSVAPQALLRLQSTIAWFTSPFSAAPEKKTPTLNWLHSFWKSMWLPVGTRFHLQCALIKNSEAHALKNMGLELKGHLWVAPFLEIQAQQQCLCNLLVLTQLESHFGPLGCVLWNVAWERLPMLEIMIKIPKMAVGGFFFLVFAPSGSSD